jgi:hypothetical protein
MIRATWRTSGSQGRDFWRPTRLHKIGLVTGLVFIGLGISTYLGDGSQTSRSDNPARLLGASALPA